MAYLIFKSKIETLNYFIDSMVIELKKQNIKYFILNIENFFEDNEKMIKFIRTNDDVIAFMFNNVGLSVVMNSGERFLKVLGVKVLNIIVDHPINYVKSLELDMPNMTVLTVDRNHAKFIHNYINKDLKVGYLPLGGTEIIEEEIPYDKREIDILYIGSNQNDHLDWEKEADDNKIDYRMIFSELSYFMAKNPQYALEEAFEIWRMEKGLSYTQEELLYIFEQIVYVEQYIRCQYKKRTMEVLANKGMRIHIYGNKWEGIRDKYPDNIFLHNLISSKECLYRIRNSKIVLNCMPWFKDGAHDRIYNAMLNKALCLTDTSKYLLTQFEHGKNIIFYNLYDLEGMVEDVSWILKHPKAAEKIIFEGYQITRARDTWQHRMRSILEETYEKCYNFQNNS